MSCKKRIKFERPTICTADKNKRITIQHRASSGSSNINTNADTDFVDIVKVWAAVKTNASGQFFDGVNLAEGITTDFVFDYTTKIDLLKPLWIKFRKRRFKVISPENINEDNLVIRLIAVERGSSLIEATKT